MTLHEESQTTDRIMTPELAVHKDDNYFWHNACFSVEGYLFQVPQYQFVVGSDYFAEKYGLDEDKGPNEVIIELEDVTAAQFRTFLKLLFPNHSISATLTFTKDEWLTILALSTLWKFHDFRRLAINHLEPLLTDPVELVQVGRSAYVPKWLLWGYEALVRKSEAITEEECDHIGDRTAIRLYIIRHGPVDYTLSQLLRSKFAGEISLLELEEMERRTKAQIEEEEQMQEMAERLAAEICEREEEEKKEREKEEERRQQELMEEARRMEEEKEEQRKEEERLHQNLVEEIKKMKEEEEKEKRREEERRQQAVEDKENIKMREEGELAKLISDQERDIQALEKNEEGREVESGPAPIAQLKKKKKGKKFRRIAEKWDTEENESHFSSENIPVPKELTLESARQETCGVV